MMGGELFDRIVQKSYYNEKEARDVTKILFEAISYCHTHQVAHRDLKPENLLLLSNTDDSNIKIADFGFAKKCRRPSSLTTQCGTPGYVAPEILEGTPYDTQADMWSLGVIVYILLGGYPPFIEQNQRYGWLFSCVDLVCRVATVYLAYLLTHSSPYLYFLPTENCFAKSARVNTNSIPSTGDKCLRTPRA
jgi:serine/threonine protein kinase